MSTWDPFREMLSLREAMNQLLEESYVRPGQGGGPARAASRTQSLALDVADRGESYVVHASLPGVRPEDVQITVLGDTLTIRAESTQATERSEGGYLLRERHTGAVQRTVTLPGPIDTDAVTADYEHGVLELTLPKSRASLPRRIQVRGSSQQSLVEQTPGLDQQQRQQTARDAEAAFGAEGASDTNQQATTREA